MTQFCKNLITVVHVAHTIYLFLQQGYINAIHTSLRCVHLITERSQVHVKQRKKLKIHENGLFSVLKEFSLCTQSKWHTPWHTSLHDLCSVMKREGEARVHSIFLVKLLLFPRSSATRSALWQRKERRENEADECKEALGGEGNASGTLNGARLGRPGTSLNLRRSKKRSCDALCVWFQSRP